jgi:hypothetical protein
MSARQLVPAVLLCLLAGLALAQQNLKTIAILDFELIDDPGTAGEAERQRLQKISDQLRREFAEKGVYKVVDNAPAAELIQKYRSAQALHACNGCELDIARKLGTDRVLTAWVQRVSDLILNLNIEIKDVKTGDAILKKSVDIRGNNDESWTRGVSYLVRDMVEKGQVNR